MKIYLASSWKNECQPDVLDGLRCRGHEVYDFRNPVPGYSFAWRELDPDWERWNYARYLRGLQHPIAERGFQLDWEAMIAADACVLLLPCGRSAHLEAGYFVGAKKPLLIYLLGPLTPELMYKMADSIHAGLDALCDRLDEIGQLSPVAAE